MNFEDVKKIGVIKGLSMGDSITAIPMLRNLKKNFPNAEITLIHNYAGAGREVLKNCPYIVKEIEFGENMSFLKRMMEAYKLRKENFDIIIDGYPNTWKSAVMSFIIGKKIRASYHHKITPKIYDILYNKKVDVDYETAIELESKILQSIGIPLKEKDNYMELFFDMKKSDKKISEQLKKCKMSRKFIIGFHFGVYNTEPRTWVPERWAELINKITEKYNVGIVFVGGWDNKIEADRVKKGLNAKPCDFIGDEKTTIEETASAIKKCGMFLCTNTGLMHMAAALKKPIIALNGASYPQWYQKGINIVNIRGKGCEYPCGDDHNCRYDKRCLNLKSVSVEDVFKEVNKMMKKLKK